jgi:hypothetical protein
MGGTAIALKTRKSLPFRTDSLRLGNKSRESGTALNKTARWNFNVALLTF